MSHTLISVLGLAATVAIAVAVHRVHARWSAARLDAMLAGLAPVIAGTVSDGRLRGTYRGRAVEAWKKKKDPSPTSPNSASSRVEVFNVRLPGVSGRKYWVCQRASSLNLFAAPKFEISGALRWLAPDPVLEERLRTAGLIEEASALRKESNPWLPMVSFLPAAQSSFAEQVLSLARFRRPDPVLEERLRAAQSALNERHGELTPSPGRGTASEEPLQASGSLTCEVEMGKSPPTQEHFRELLDQAVRLAQINAAANH